LPPCAAKVIWREMSASRWMSILCHCYSAGVL
jgi:hypothetical protein